MCLRTCRESRWCKQGRDPTGPSSAAAVEKTNRAFLQLSRSIVPSLSWQLLNERCVNQIMALKTERRRVSALDRGPEP
jgi:hypothetical protein